ncbi:MAG: hypothetical protein PVF74_09595 [Anaerolineales bacterium]|jgi:hypothetical protein
METSKSKQRWIGTGLAGIVASAMGLALYYLVIRPWHLRWGATDDEVARPLQGDELVPSPKLKTTHAITINATPAEIWPWLVQLGQGRGGFYSYDWIENAMGLDIHTTNQILPEFQDLKVGDMIPLAQDGFGIPVAFIKPGQALVLHGDTRQPSPGVVPVLKPGDFFTVSWGFYLFDRQDGSTRLVERWHADWNPAFHNTLFYRIFLEPSAFIMERKMLVGIKGRVEGALKSC